MKKTLFFLLLTFHFSLLTSFAQLNCHGGRYYSNLFSGSNISANVVYGSNTAVGSSNQETLTMDIYQPTADTASKRPVIIFVHGGSFIAGTKNDNDCVALCQSFAKMGYVTASINYRVGNFFLNGLNDTTTTLAVMRGMHDVKAAIRFFRKDAATTNTYKIDTNFVVIGGVSAGSVAVIHAAYLNKLSEMPAYLYPDTAGLGGVEGNSGNPGYSTNVAAVIDYAGAIGDTIWIEHNDVQIVSVHYDGDVTVPYGTSMVSVQGIPTGLTASGSGDMKIRANHENMRDSLMTFHGVGHVEFLTGTAFDTVVAFTRDFLFYNFCSAFVSTQDIAAPDLNLKAYPNPSTGDITITVPEYNGTVFNYVLMDVTGRIVLKMQSNKSDFIIERKNLNNGLYILKVYNKEFNAVKELSLQ